MFSTAQDLAQLPCNAQKLAYLSPSRAGRVDMPFPHKQECAQLSPKWSGGHLGTAIVDDGDI